MSQPLGDQIPMPRSRRLLLAVSQVDEFEAVEKFDQIGRAAKEAMLQRISRVESQVDFVGDLGFPRTSQ